MFRNERRFILSNTSIEIGAYSLVANITDVLDRHQLMGSIAEALRMPEYFGNNWDALYDSLCSLDWLPPGSVAIVHSELPRQMPAEDVRTYLDILSLALNCPRNGDGHRLDVVFPIDAKATLVNILSSIRVQRARDFKWRYEPSLFEYYDGNIPMLADGSPVVIAHVPSRIQEVTQLFSVYAAIKSADSTRWDWMDFDHFVNRMPFGQRVAIIHSDVPMQSDRDACLNYLNVLFDAIARHGEGLSVAFSSEQSTVINKFVNELNVEFESWLRGEDI